MSKTLLERAKEYRELVLLAELAGWLHDLGKLSSGFVLSKTDSAYATGVEAEVVGEEETISSATKEKWKHEQVFSDEEPHDGKRLSHELKQALQRPLTGPNGWLKEGALESDQVTLERLVAGHQAPWKKLPKLPWIQRLLVQADRDDSGEDEYNAVGLHQKGAVQSSSVFGREEPLARGDLQSLDQVRQGFYSKLEPLVTGGAPAANRRQLWELLERTMKQGLGKTQRAANDVRLDQHAWGVAARFKAFLLRDLLDPPSAEQEPPRRTFRLLTVLWNSWELITPFARLSDVVGREVMLAELRKALRQAIEEEYALGNRIYEDNDGVHFLIADLPWGRDLTELVCGIVNEVTGGEVQPVVQLSPPTERVTDLVEQMREARREVPVVGNPAWARQWADSPSGKVCPVCQRRPLEGERDLCPWCEKRRRGGIERRLTEGGTGTVWTGEIADNHERLALIVARFNPEHWLDGTMLHTLFITSPQDMADLYPAMQNTADWHHIRIGVQRLLEGRSLDTPPKQYQSAVKKAQKRLQQSEEPHIPLERQLEMRAEAKRQLEEAVSGFWAALINREMDRYKGDKSKRISEVAENLQRDYQPTDAFLLALARKNPSASRLLRVWQTTEEFLHQQARQVEVLVKERQRVVFTLDKMPLPSGIYKANVPILGRIDVFIRPKDGKVQTINFLTQALRPLRERLQEKKFHFVARERGRSLNNEEKEPLSIQDIELEDYRPYQVITASPNLLLMMVPADKAMEVTEKMQSAYVEEFGKVQDRLPFHVGLIFMNAHYPMFASLDTARRLVESFGQLDEKPSDAVLQENPEENGDGYDLSLHSDRFGAWTWHVPAQRGDRKTDWYHPYFLVQQGKDLEKRGMSLIGPKGRWVHVSKLQKDDRIAFRPNLFDFIFLDTVSRRLETQLDQETRRRSHPLLGEHHSPRPYLLERVRHLSEVWKAICNVDGMSETRLEGATSLLARKWEAWQLASADSPERQAAWKSYSWLVDQVAARDFGKKEELRKKIKEAIFDGSFFDTVELYRHILKQPIESKQKVTQSPGQY